MSAESSLFTLNEVATAIWEAADGSRSLTEIVNDVVCAHFDVTPEVAAKDAEELVERLSRHGLLRVAEQPIRDAE